MRYRRAKTPGGTYFFTVVTFQRRKFLCEPGNVELLRTAFRTVNRRAVCHIRHECQSKPKKEATFNWCGNCSVMWIDTSRHQTLPAFLKGLKSPFQVDDDGSPIY
jgi:hypothetical protein